MKKINIFRLVTLVVMLSMVFLFMGCKEKREPKMNESNPEVTIELQDGKKIVIELYPHVAPNTVTNFISLVESGYYDGVVFHRAVPNFMLQGGDPTGTGTGGPGYEIVGEFVDNGYNNSLSHTEGVISMARALDPNSAGSQFFICDSDESVFLDGQYAGFGKVIQGINTVKELAASKTVREQLVDPIVMKKVTVDTFGISYGQPIISPK